MNITLLKYPTDEDWAFAKQCALVTIGKEMKTAPDMEWKHSILRAQHSPIRTLQFAFAVLGKHPFSPPRPRTAVYPVTAE